MNFRQAAEAISKNNQEPKWLLDLRLNALSEFEKALEPKAKDEEWRKVDLSQLLFTDLDVNTSAATAKYQAPQGIFASTLTQAAREVPEIVRPYLEKSQERNNRKFDALNNALWNGGAFLHVPKGASADKPLGINLVPPAFGSGRQGFFPKRILVFEENSSLTLSSEEKTPSDWHGWLGSETELHLKTGAKFSFVRIQAAGIQTTTLSSLWARLERNAELNFLVVSLGSSLCKSNWSVDLAGEGASARIFGLVKGTGTQNYNHTVMVDHLQPHTDSNVLFKAAVSGKSRSMFTGLIHVGKTAQKTNSYQTNRNLILDKEAHADTLPKLEIEADDVRCGHGAAVSNVDPDQVYYLMSRGLNREEARAVIIEGFYEDVLARWLENISAKAYSEDILENLKNSLFASQSTPARV